MWLPRDREKSAGLVATTWTCLVAVICAAVTPAPCDKTRRIFTESSGIITDGPTGSNYTQDSHCEWLIKARNSSQYITLNFIRMGTECSYDYVFVYDGDSFNSPLLGSFSGNTEPQQVTASSGFMLVLLYSDTNYVLDGFKAEFSVHNCPNNCSKRGLCVGGKCVCEGEWGGRDCSVELCPLSCSGHGQCRGGRCQCYKGYSGEGCTLKDVEKDGNQWHWLSRTESGLRPRAAHSAVYVNVTDSLYVFGGYNLNDVLDSLQVYRFRKSQWEDELGNVLGHLSSDQVDENLLREVLTQGNLDGRWQLGNRSSFFNQLLLSSISHGDNSHFGIFHDASTTPYSEKVINLDHKQRDLNEDEEHYNITSAEIDTSKPLPRYGHAACGTKDGFVLYGGKLASGSLSSELWYFNALQEEWTLRALNSDLTPPGLTRHTLTAVDDELYVFGGSTMEGEFSSRMFRINLTSPETESWEEVKVRGGKELDVRVVAHTAVYHSYSHSILVYGGVVAGVARFSKLSDRMFAFDIDNKHWSELHYPRAHLRDTYVPRERAFHTSTVIGNYLVVFGGYSHRHNREEICYDGQMYLYHLGCHAWIPLEVLGKPNRYLKKQGVFAHAAALRPPSTLLIAGGYHGNVNGDLLAFVVPTWQGGITSMDSEAACPKHKTDSECLADPECGWCSVDGICYGRTIGSNCTTNLQSVRCGGICPALGDCHSCLIHGPSPAALAAEHLTSPRKPLPSISTKLGLHQCTWCVQNARCHHKDDNYGVCGEDTPSQSPGWWGATGTEVTSPNKCRELDRRPGLTFIRYQQPADRNYPDGVTIVNATTVDWVPGGHNFNILSGPSEARLKGWLRIPESWSGAGEKLQVCAGFANVSLHLGEEGSERVAAKLVAEPADCSPVDWPNLSAGRISVDLFANDSLSARPFTSHQQSKMELQHNKSNENLKVFTFEYLEPYSNGSCSANDNCLLCLADAACGWCELTKKCESRDSDEQISCRQKDDWRYLTLQPSACPNCSNYINCERCVNSGLCEWWADEARCSRLGRALNATTSVDDCPVPCRDRVDCTQCLDDRGRCVWCEATQQCFSFSVYTSEYQFGLCREWLDRASPLIAGDIDTSNVHRADQCKSCSSYTNCSACLQNLGCGWCYSEDNPIHGVCTQGDFTRAYTECHTLLDTSWDETLWAYAQCPDVDECGLGLHDCHKNAICNNTHGSYSCKCRKGYIGDGRTSCTQTCYNSCIHGYCLGQPDFVCQCDLGWTGVDCSQNCGCHNHSTCRAGIGFCDECKDWTEGEYCERCKPGSYGNATSSQGCRRCDCNDHGDETLGVCDIDTGVCICKENTEGPNCEKCSGDYYGDPRHGQRCYYQCEARGMLKGSFEKGIGSFKSHSSPWGSPPTKECLWIISSEGLSSNNAIIQFSINNTKLNVSCDDNAVYVYDGIIGVPELGIGQQSQLIGVFCKDISPGTVEAYSGNLTVHYKQGPVGQGFEGVYKILTCDKDCVSPRKCEKGQCVCNDSLTGPNCEIELCPNNCTSFSQQGVCDRAYGRCLCFEGWGGPDCSVKIEKHQLIFTELFNTTHLAEHFDHLRKTLPRFGHSLVADRRGLWMFGGYSLSHGPLNDIRLFDTKNNTWMQVTVEATPDAKMPAGRYFHAAEISHPKQIIYIYGGLRVQEKGLENKTLHDFWQFSLKDQRWSMVVGEEEQPPPLAGHTLTYQKNQIYESLVLIGGFSLEKGFLPDIWEFNLGDNKWKKLQTNGSKPIGICGHSTVYHAPTQSLYVFGGILFTVNGTIVSNKLFSLHYPSLRWSELPTFPILNDPIQNLPRPSYLHSAVTTNEYMIVFGGRADTATETDILTAYVYNCNQWIRLLEHSEVVGMPPLPTIAHAMTLDYDPENGRNSTIYIVGGWTGGAQCQVTRVTIPEDLCQLWHQNKYTCRAHMACSFCSSNGANECYSYEKTGCEGSNSTIRTSGGLPCDGKFIASRTCANFTTCGTCLAAWPAHPEESAVCQWCESCGRGQCLSIGEDCLRLGQKCETLGVSLTNVSLCVDSVCTASDCEKCSSDYCVWTRQVINEVNGPKIHDDPIYNWTCTSKEGLGRSLLRLRHFEKCPVRCHYHQDCRSCLRSEGAEGGFSECRWATHLNKCLGPAYQPLYCAGGVCGLVLSSDEIEQCPSPCMSFEQCAECLRHAHCGWCSRDGASGDGICTEGSMESPFNYPAQSTCEVLYGTRNNWQEPYPNDTFTWNYIKCPPENECENGHHNCDPVSERCEDLPLGYQCVCGPGHKLAGAACLPVCSQGCVRGNCIQPDVCECDFGYVGANCSIQCQCNGHANCEGPDKLNHCLECHNNTMGKQCEKCKPLFVGDPTDYGTCTPCSTYCHGHTAICMSETSDLPLPSHEMSKHELEDYFGEGPTIRARCVRCANNTDGSRCDKCIEGHFRGSEDYRDPCRPCECHGHGDICDPVTGEKCNCGNNTESELSCQTSSSSKNSAQECWRFQCVKCKDLYMGDPKNGHQCYKIMSADNKMCFDAKSIDDCKLKPGPLHPGQTVFFVVIPRFMNVDIRVIVDVTQGAVDLFMSPNDSSFVVSVNTSTGAHYVDLDPSYFKHDPFRGTDSFSFDDNHFSRPFDGNIEYILADYKAGDLATFVTVDKRDTLLRIRDLRNRLVLTIPQSVHNLQFTKFYLVLRALPTEEGSASYGMVFFRQDQLHIDLFVFFSVFFSCFFLFLAACVVAWKAKQAADVRRARRRHVVEMLHMAKRPFAMVTIVLSGGPASLTNSSGGRRRRRAADVRPVAVEPTCDGVAAVTSVLVRLPGGKSAPVRLALASSLVLLARQSQIHNRPFLRRRSIPAPPPPT